MYIHNVKLKGTGSYLPQKIITNHDISKNIDTTHDWIYNNLGIRERRIVGDESVSDLVENL